MVHPPLVLVAVVVAVVAHLLQILPLHLRVVAVLASLVQALAERQEQIQIPHPSAVGRVLAALPDQTVVRHALALLAAITAAAVVVALKATTVVLAA